MLGGGSGWQLTTMVGSEWLMVGVIVVMGGGWRWQPLVGGDWRIYFRILYL